MSSSPSRASETQTSDDQNAAGQASDKSVGGQNASKQAEKASRSRKSGPRKSSGAFRTISEVADELNVQQHVLRFWETKFSHVRPLKRGGGRRYYRPEDVDLLKRIHHLLYVEGYTIKGVQKLLREVGKNQVLKGAGTNEAIIRHQPAEDQQAAAAEAMQNQQKQQTFRHPPAANQGLTDGQRNILETMLDELKELRNIIKPKK